MNLRHSTYSGTGIPSRCLLVNGNSRAQALNGIHIRLVHLAEELAGITGQAFHIAPLAFRVNRIEGQGTFSAAAQSCDDRQLISRYLQRNVLQVVLTRTPDNQVFIHVFFFSCCLSPLSEPHPRRVRQCSVRNSPRLPVFFSSLPYRRALCFRPRFSRYTWQCPPPGTGRRTSGRPYPS